MRKRTIYFLVLSALLAASNCFAAKVTNVEISHQSGYTVARIDIDGTVRFTHQTEIAKDGKPFRVIVDVLSATHELGSKSFLSLPKCAVLHIRSSQFSVKPEKIVRLVFDMGAESVYQIGSDSKSIRLKFPDKSAKAFPIWSTLDVVSNSVKQKNQPKVLASTSKSVASAVSKSAKLSSKSAAQLNRSIEADRQSSLASSDTPSIPAKVAAVQPKKSTTASSPVLTKSEPEKKITRPIITKETLARASGSKSSYPPERETTKFEPGKVAQNASASTEKKQSTSKAGIETKSKPASEVHAGQTLKPEKTVAKPHASEPKTSSKVSNPRTLPSTVTVAKTVAPKKNSKTTSGPVLASNSDQEKARKPVIKKAKTDKAAASEKKSTVQTGSLDKSAQSVVKKSSDPKTSAKKPADSKQKLNSSEKTTKPSKSAPAKPKPKKKKKAVYASNDKSSTSGSVKPVAKKKAKATVDKKVNKKSGKAKAKVSASKSSKSSKKQLAQKKDDNQRPTSRFRRSRGESNKIKGTMVAEFPKRLVIKYRGTARRDPFETLVNERKTNNSLLERKVPNAEGLKLVGIIEAADGDNRALFEDTDGYGYIMKSGDKVRKGYVLRVELDRVYFQVFEYGWSRTVALNLEEY